MPTVEWIRFRFLCLTNSRVDKLQVSVPDQQLVWVSMSLELHVCHDDEAGVQLEHHEAYDVR